MSQGFGHESTLELDYSDFSSQFDSQDPDKAVTLVRSVLTQRRQAVQVRTPDSSSTTGWVSRVICAPGTLRAWTAPFPMLTSHEVSTPQSAH